MFIHGIQSGALIQRNAGNIGEAILTGSFTGTPCCTPGNLSLRPDGRWLMSGLPVGGPYNVTITDDTDSQTFTGIYVGDLWLLAGQSNMEGAGRMTPEDDADTAFPNPRLRAFYMDDHWDAAVPTLHDQAISPDGPIRRVYENHEISIRQRGLTILDGPPGHRRRTVGPGLAFAQEMYRLTGIPQGVIPTAVGGAPIEMWMPDGSDNFFAAAARRIRECGSRIRGIFWAQGEGNTHPEQYPAQITQMREAFDRLTEADTLPFVQMQSFRFTTFISRDFSKSWSSFREMQRRMPALLPNLATVATNDTELDDCIHLSAGAQRIMGIRAARAMHHLITGEGFPQPEPDTIFIRPGECVEQFCELHIRYRNVDGALTSAGIPFGFSMQPADSDEEPTIRKIQRILLRQNTVVIRTEFTRRELEALSLWYGYGNSFYCNITDTGGRAIPSMGPVRLANYLKGNET